MKPPPRARSLPDRYLNRKTDQKQRRRTNIVCTWKRNEQKNLLMALKKLLKVVGDTGEMDYAFLKKHVPSRSTSEIHSVVEALKTKIISLVTYEVVKQVQEERRVKKPIDMWLDLSSIISGVLEEPVSTAFSQTFMVCSTEPRTLRNSHPPHNHNSVKQKTGGDGAILLRPVPQALTLGQLHGNTKATPVLLMRNPHNKTLTMGHAPPLAVITQGSALTTCTASSPSGGKLQPACSPRPAESAPHAASSTSGQDEPIAGAKAVSTDMALAKHNDHASVQPTAPAKDSDGPEQQTRLPSSSSSAATGRLQPGSSQTDGQTVASTTSAASVPPSSQPPSPSLAPAAAIGARLGRTSEHVREDSPTVLGTKYIVNFEKIYHYLSVVENKKEECTLNPMESAVVLDLLMSLPEELPLLPCNKLQKHFRQVYSSLTNPANHKAAMEMYTCEGPNTEAEGKDTEEQVIIDANRGPLQAGPHQHGNPTASTSQRNDETCAMQSSTGSHDRASGSAPVGFAPVGSVPVGSVPVGSVPVCSAPVCSAPVGSVPVGSVPVCSAPVGSAPVGSVPVGSVPVGSVPVGSAPVGSATVQQGECKTVPPNSKNSFRQLENWKEELVCPLNPFLVPLSLLKRTQE